MWYIWLIAAGIFFIAEIATVGFLIFWLGVAALLTMVVSLVFDSIFVQMFVFVVTSVLLILLTKPFINKYVSTSDNSKTNINSLINQKGVVISEINPINSVGQVKVNGEIWSAKTEDNSVIEKDTEIEVLKIDGVKLVVKKINIYTNN